MYAVISAGGKQVKVAEGDIIQIERQEAHPGDSVTFSEVLMLAEGSDLNLGTPLVEKATVFGTVLAVLRSPKILVFKKKKRKQYRRMRGHRQYQMRVRIDEIGLHAERKKKAEELPPPAAPRRPAEIGAGKAVKTAKKKKETKTAGKMSPAARKTVRAVGPAAKGSAKSRAPKKPAPKGKKR